METRQERITACKQLKIEKRIHLYSECMQQYLALKNPRLTAKSCCLVPTLKAGEVFLPLHRGEEYLECYKDFFDEVTQDIELQSDVCSLIFTES